ncbi:hypothetical protein OQA88_8941 [Cercophora sp. LCS_1]
MLSFLFFAAAVSAGRLMDALAAVPAGWKETTVANGDPTLTLHVALRWQEPKAQALEDALIEMSTPGHPNYGMHMTREEIQSYTAPSDPGVVKAWLKDHGVESMVGNMNDWITFTTTKSVAERLLNTTFNWYEYEGGGGPKLRTLSYSVPEHVADHIDLVQPTTRFGRFGTQGSTIFEMHRVEEAVAIATKTTAFVANAADDAPACASTITPACLRWLYNVNYTASAGPENRVAFTSYLEQYARYSDLEMFQGRYIPAAKGQNFTVELINGGLDDQASRGDSGEANLDLQYLMGISYPIPVVEYSTGGRGPLIPTRDQPTPPGTNEPYLEWLLYMLNLTDAELPQTITTSYGEEEQSIPESYARRTCDMFKQLGARGVSIMFSSGDSGPGNSCVRNTNNQTYFEPTYPAACPWVTSVGATMGTNPERAVSYSSGGFSLYHPQPKYQKNAVKTYLDGINSTYAPYFNRSNRAIPDVSALGTNFAVYDKGYLTLLSGTSASSPVFAGIIALLNAARRTQHRPPLGFLNPWLYNISDAFTDITVGAGSGCFSNPDFGGRAAWNATVGWDPVTGLGTPKFDRMLHYAAPGVPNV